MKPLPTARQVIRAAIAAAGGTQEVARALGISSPSVTGWSMRGRIPSDRIAPLCALQTVVTPEQILEALARESAEKAAA